LESPSFDLVDADGAAKPDVFLVVARRMHAMRAFGKIIREIVHIGITDTSY
jgi:hypothetical protein